MKARRGAHTVYRLAYHFVWIPRYRRKVLVGDVAQRLEELIREMCMSNFPGCVRHTGVASCGLLATMLDLREIM